MNMRNRVLADLCADLPIHAGCTGTAIRSRAASARDNGPKPSNYHWIISLVRIPLHHMLVSPNFGTISFSMVNSGVPNSSCGPSAVALKPNASYRRIARVKNGVVLRNSRAQSSSTATHSICSSSSRPIPRPLAMGSTAIPRT